MHSTLLEALAADLLAEGKAHPTHESPPAVVLWLDEDGQWEVPELHSEDVIDSDPLPPGQVWAISPGGQETGPSLYRIEITTGPGNGVRILNHPVPPLFRESVKVGEQNLYVRAKELVGDRNPRDHEFTIQMRAMDRDSEGKGLGLAALIGLCSAQLERSIKGGLINSRGVEFGRLLRTPLQSRGYCRTGRREGRNYGTDANQRQKGFVCPSR